MVVEEVAGDQNEIDLLLLRPGQDVVQGFEAVLADLDGGLEVEAGDPQPQVQVGGVQEGNHAQEFSHQHGVVGLEDSAHPTATTATFFEFRVASRESGRFVR